MARKKLTPEKAALVKGVKSIHTAREWAEIIKQAGLFDPSKQKTTPMFFFVENERHGQMVCIFEPDKMIGGLSTALERRFGSLIKDSRLVSARDARDEIIRIAKERGLDLDPAIPEDRKQIETIGHELYAERQQLHSKYRSELRQRINKHLPIVINDALIEIAQEVFNLVLQDANGQNGFTTDSIGPHRKWLIRSARERKLNRLGPPINGQPPKRVGIIQRDRVRAGERYKTDTKMKQLWKEAKQFARATIRGKQQDRWRKIVIEAYGDQLPAKILEKLDALTAAQAGRMHALWLEVSEDQKDIAISGFKRGSYKTILSRATKAKK